MNVLHLALHSLRRDWRSGEMRLIAVAVVIAVASLTAVKFFTDRVRLATEYQATELLAADLVLRSRDPVPDAITESAHAAGLRYTHTTSFRSVVLAGEKMQIAEVKAVQAGYPLRGKLKVADALFGEEKVTERIPAPGTAWADARLLQILDVAPGDQISLGASRLTVTKILTYEPDRGGDLFNIAPRLLINLADLPATKLILPGSRISYRLLLGGDIDNIARFRKEIEKRDYPGLRVQGIRDARPELKRALERSEQFLGLAVIVGIALAGLAVAMSAQRYVVRHFDNCAVMRCLGAEQKTIIAIHVIQLLILALLCSLAGCAIGYAAQEGLARLIAGISRVALPAPGFTPLLAGLTAGVITVLGFALPQFLRLGNVSPLRVLRRDLAPLPVRGMTSYLAAVLALASLTPWRSGNLALTAYTLAGMVLTALLLMLGSLLLIRALNRLRSRVGVASRFGLANIARRAGPSIAQIVGIGLGVMVMLLLTLIRTDLLDAWRDRLPAGTPNYFLINIQPDEVTAMQNFIRDNAGMTPEFFPMIRGRLTAINGREVDPDAYADPRAQRLASRDFNLSIAKTMQADNKLSAGHWWTADKNQRLFSVEDGIAETLGIKLNDALTYIVAGKEITGTVANLRWVEWDSFNVNFFVVANPGFLDSLPATYISSFYLPGQKRRLLIDLVRTFPSVTVIDVDAILSQVRLIMEQVVKTIEFVFGFTLLAGLIVMAAALQTTHDQRARESALLNALGASRKQILSSLTAEFLCLGLIAGVLSAFSATIIEMVLAKYVFKMDIVVNPWIWLIAPLVCVTVVVLGGLLGTRKILSTPPVAALRQV